MRIHFALALAMLASPAFAQKVKVDYDRDYAWGEIHTYAWSESEDPDPNTLVHEQVLASMKKWLGESGVREAADGESPDILLSYRSNSENVLKLDVRRFSAGSTGGAALIIARDGTFERGTLMLEARDGATGKLVYHGVASAAMETMPSELSEKIDKACRKLVDKFWNRVYSSDPDLHPLEGLPVTAVDFTGQKKTRDYMIARELRVPIGEPLDLAKVDEDVIRLDNLSIFAQVRVDAEKQDEGVRLEYQVEEMPPFIPYPAASYTEENGFSVGVGVAAGNMGGRGIRLSGRALFGGTKNYNALLQWPWITGNHFSFGFVGAHLERDDEVREFREMSDEIQPWIGSYFAGDRGRLELGYMYFRMQSDVDGVTLGEDNDDSLHRIGFSVGWDTRDSWNLPHHGWLNEVEVWRTGGFLGGEGNFWTVDTDIRRFQPLSSQWRTLVLASLLTLQSGEAFVDVPSYNRYHLGGANSLRGYDITDLGKRLSGKNQWLSTLELRQTVLKPRRYDILKWAFKFGLEVAAIGDLGYAWDDDFDWNSFRGGVGLGVRLLKPGTGMTRLDVGWSRAGGFQLHFGGGSKMARQRLRIR